MAEPEVGPKPSWVPTQERIVYDGGFRTNIGAFLKQFGSPITLQTGAAPVRAWTVDVKETEEEAHPLLQLYVYEDPADVTRPPVCDHCRIIGVLKVLIVLVPGQHLQERNVEQAVLMYEGPAAVTLQLHLPSHMQVLLLQPHCCATQAGSSTL